MEIISIGVKDFVLGATLLFGQESPYGQTLKKYAV